MITTMNNKNKKKTKKGSTFEGFPTSKCLSSHLHRHNPTNHYVCDKCGKPCYNISRLNSHTKHMHPDGSKPIKVPEQCAFCGKWYCDQAGLNKHIKNKHTNTEIEHRCETCGFVSISANALKSHIMFNHDVVRRHKCNLCEKSFKRKQDLKEHLATHTGESLYTCGECGATFKSNANMYHHRRRFHKKKWAADLTKPLQDD